MMFSVSNNPLRFGLPTTAGVTLESMKKAVDEFRRRFPPERMPIAFRGGERVLKEIRAACMESADASRSAADMQFLVDELLPYPVHVVEMQDGTELVYVSRGIEPIRRKTVRHAGRELSPHPLDLPPSQSPAPAG